MRRTARHARTSHRARRGLRATLAVALTATALPVALSVSAPTAAAAADPCTVPQLSDVMISQGLPSYTALVAGKQTLVKLFLSTPSCLPAGASVSVSSAELTVTGATTTPVAVQAPLPLPPIGPASTAPVPATASDLLFLVPGEAMRPRQTQPGQSVVSFSVRVEYTVRSAAGSLSDPVTITFGTTPQGTPLGATVLNNPNPMNLLVVPMGNTALSASSQYNPTDVQTGIDTLRRILPLPSASGLNVFTNAGMLNVGSAPFCATLTNFRSTVAPGLEAARVAWNAENGLSLPNRPAAPHANKVLGQIDQSISLGPSTPNNNGCADGFAQLGTAAAGEGVVTFGRVVRSSTAKKVITGSIQAMELAHSAGAVTASYPFNKQASPLSAQRADSGNHSTNEVADVTAPNRAYNLATRAFIPSPSTVMRYSASTWDDTTSMLEKQDWDYLMCGLYPPSGFPESIDAVLGANAPQQLTTCENPGRMGYSAAVAAATYPLIGGQRSGTFGIAGATDGTAEGTSVYVTSSESVSTDPQQPNSAYRLLQRAGNQVLADYGVPVRFVGDHHDQDNAGTPVAPSTLGSFGITVPASVGTTTLDLVRRTEGKDVVLFSRTVSGPPPTFRNVEVQGNALTVTADSAQPEDLRLDVLVACDGAPASPVKTNIPPTVTTPRTAAVFTTSYDASLACPDGRLVYRVSDGLRTVRQIGGEVDGGRQVAAQLTAPAVDQKLVASQAVGFAGSATDELGNPATSYTFAVRRSALVDGATVTKEYPATPGTSTVVPPTGGFPSSGSYFAVMRAFRGTTQLAEVTQPVAVLADTDGDGIPDQDEAKPCYGSSPTTDPSNANLDSDGDGVPNINDPAPCVSSATAQVAFQPQSLYKSANGNFVSVSLTSSAVDLTTLKAGDLYITQVAGHRVQALAGSATALPAIIYSATSPSTATAQFDRQKLSAALGQLTGYLPVFVGTLDGRLRGADVRYPKVFP